MLGAFQSRSKPWDVDPIPPDFSFQLLGEDWPKFGEPLARGLDAPQELQDGVGSFLYNTPFFRFPETPVGVAKPPVALGEDNEYVYKEVIGLSDAEYDALQEQGHIGLDYDESIR